MSNKKNTESKLSKVLALGMVATSISIGGQSIAPNKVDAQKTTSYTQQSSSKTGTVTASVLTVRKGPSTSYSDISYLRYGNKVTITQTCSNGWHKIKTSSGKIGYVSGKYIKVSSSSSSSNSNSNSNSSNNNSNSNSNSSSSSSIKVVTTYSKIVKVGTVNVSSLNLRRGPSTSNSRISSLRKGTVVGIRASYNNGWYKVQLKSGTTGYVYGRYLNIKSGDISDLGSSSTSSSNNSSTSNTSSKVQAVISLAKKQIGKPYVYGAAGPRSFDCSGLTYYCYKNAAGKTLNRSSAAQVSNGRYVSKKSLKPGDLVFFNSGTSRVRHVGLYVGSGKFIHSPRPGRTVTYENLYSSYYINTYVTARRIIG